jgi:hypothetical protein
MKISSEFFGFSWWLDRARRIVSEKMCFKLKKSYKKKSKIPLSSGIMGNRPQTLAFGKILL